MNAVRRLIGAVAVAALTALVSAGCGPTASAIRPTLPTRTFQPDSSSVTAFPPGGGQQSVTPAGSATPPPGGIATRIAGFQQGAAYEVRGVTVTPSGYVAVGFEGTGQGFYGVHQGVVWRSADGQTWNQTVDAAFTDVTPSGVVAIGDTVYVFGEYAVCSQTSDIECSEDPNAGTVIFRSTGAGPWEQLAQTTNMIGASLDGMTAWGNTLVAWGSAADENGTTTLWTSSDALNWTATADLAGIDPIDSVAAGGPGLMAFGGKYDDAIGDTQLIGATSTDGSHFTQAAVPSVTGATVMSIVAGPGGYAAVGSAASASNSTPSTSMALSSADGTTWAQSNASDGSFDNTLLNDVHSSASGYVSVGSSIGVDDPTLQAGRVWVSADGKSWRSLGDFGGLFSQFGDSAVGPGGLVVFTMDEHDSNADGTDVTSTIYAWLVPADHLNP